VVVVVVQSEYRLINGWQKITANWSILTIPVHRVLALSSSDEEKNRPETDTCHPLPDLWCCSRKEV